MAKEAARWNPFSSKRVGPTWGKSEKGIVVGPSGRASLGSPVMAMAGQLSLTAEQLSFCERVQISYEYSSPKIDEIVAETAMVRDPSEGAMERARAARDARLAIVSRRTSRRMPGMRTTPTSPQADKVVDFDAANNAASRRVSRRSRERTSTPPASPKARPTTPPASPKAKPTSPEAVAEDVAAEIIRRTTRRISERTSTPPPPPKTETEVLDFSAENVVRRVSRTSRQRTPQAPELEEFGAGNLVRRISRRFSERISPPERPKSILEEFGDGNVSRTSRQRTPPAPELEEFGAGNLVRRMSRRFSERTTPPQRPKSILEEFGDGNVVRRSRLSRRMSGLTSTPPRTPPASPKAKPTSPKLEEEEDVRLQRPYHTVV